MEKHFCDICDKEVPGAYWERIQCSQGRHGEYHKECLIEVFGQLYCKTHAVRAENRKTISDYVAKVWADMGYAGTVNESNGVVNATVGPCVMQIEPDYDVEATTLSFVNLQVRGLTSGTKTFKASLCDHETVVKQLQGAIVRSLRSTKSSITQKKKKMDEDVAKMDILIAELMGKLGGVMPDDTSISAE